MKSLKFKQNFIGMIVSFMGVTMLGGFTYYRYKVNLFDNTIVHQAIRQAKLNSNVCQKIGQQIQHNVGYASKIQQPSQQEKIFTFGMKGNKGQEMSATVRANRLQLYEVYKPKSIKLLQKTIKEHQQLKLKAEQILQSKQALWTKTKQKKEKQILNKQIQNIKAQIQSINNQLKNQISQKNKTLWRLYDDYYIPQDNDVKIIIEKAFSLDSEEVYPDTRKMWNISQLVLKNAKNEEEIIIKPTPKIFKEYQLNNPPEMWTYKKLFKKNLATQQGKILPQYKNKMNFGLFLVSNIGYTFALVMVIVMLRKLTRRMGPTSLVGSYYQFQIKNIVQKHPKFYKKEKIVWDNFISGGILKDRVEMQFQLLKPEKGTIKVQGKYDVATKKINTEKIVFKSKERQFIIDILKNV